MKRFWKRVNRGLLLGAVLIVLLIATAAAGEVRFYLSASRIGASAKEAVTELLALNLSPTDATLGAPLDKEAKTAREAAMERYLKAYWDSDGAGLYYMGASDVRRGYGEYLQDAQTTLYYEIETQIPDRAISVRRNGGSCAIVSIDLSQVTMTFAGDGESPFCGSYYGEENATEDARTGVFRGSYRGYAELEMHRTGGEWRVCGISMYLNLYSKSAASLPTGGGT